MATEPRIWMLKNDSDLTSNSELAVERAIALHEDSSLSVWCCFSPVPSFCTTPLHFCVHQRPRRPCSRHFRLRALTLSQNRHTATSTATAAATCARSIRSCSPKITSKAIQQIPIKVRKKTSVEPERPVEVASPSFSSSGGRRSRHRSTASPQTMAIQPPTKIKTTAPTSATKPHPAFSAISITSSMPPPCTASEIPLTTMTPETITSRIMPSTTSQCLGLLPLIRLVSGNLAPAIPSVSFRRPYGQQLSSHRGLSGTPRFRPPGTS